MKAYITTNPDKYQALLLKEFFDATIVEKENGIVQYMVIFAPLDQKQKASLLPKEIK